MRIYSEQELAEMKPQELTSLLYQAFLEKLRGAIKALEEKDLIGSNYLIQGCNDILERLGAGINYKAGIIADQLEALYDFCAHRLIEANIKKDKEMLQQVLKIMENISQGWFTAMEVSDLETSINKKLENYESHLYYEEANLDIVE
ncbi:flagellar export chaperone FliS [Lutispora thermophila]|uniref:Flagellar protein FliS n=1 Tax=Lutispora thermophila DSM 19022 TaxID=1122184 RepID=A0A1M6AP05_9FIRM|nr:flagellar export chaperone FliS [Lutispora thermophila]SHI38230.1 flagellar protein FliS [Lutispora thermophila DSM 19022]